MSLIVCMHSSAFIAERSVVVMLSISNEMKTGVAPDFGFSFYLLGESVDTLSHNHKTCLLSSPLLFEEHKTKTGGDAHVHCVKNRCFGLCFGLDWKRCK